MPVIAVINRKGGSGKSTLATHLAAWLARQGVAVMLGDVDRQQSTRTWLKRRSPALPTIAPWAIDQKNVLKAPHGVTHVVLDTPGGMQGFELARVVMSADAVLVPVCNSLFDRESGAACLAELADLPRVASSTPATSSKVTRPCASVSILAFDFPKPIALPAPRPIRPPATAPTISRCAARSRGPRRGPPRTRRWSGRRGEGG